jgi:hypothetical protein
MKRTVPGSFDAAADAGNWLFIDQFADTTRWAFQRRRRGISIHQYHLALAEGGKRARFHPASAKRLIAKAVLATAHHIQRRVNCFRWRRTYRLP